MPKFAVSRSCICAAMLLTALFLVSFGCKSKPKLGFTEDAVQAIRQDHAATLKTLLDAGVDPNGKNDAGFTPLTLAASFSSNSSAELLLNEGADANRSSEAGDTPLTLAVTANNIKLINTLVKAGANVNAPNKSGAPPLAIALDEGNCEVINALLQAGAKADFSVGGKSSIELATGLPEGCASKVISELVKHGAKVEGKAGAPLLK